MKALPIYAVFAMGPAMLIVSGCSGEPSQADIWEMFEAKGKENGNVVLHEAKKLGCKASREPQKGHNFYWDVEVDPTSMEKAS